ncbi:MAG: hypothetical protein U9R01_08395 [candidate division WOR-3 bacterium]|nr:hypothetical protein [candidate division WOR-3 bacterium]
MDRKVERWDKKIGLTCPAGRQDKRSQRGERGREKRDEREGIDDFSPFAFRSSRSALCG